MLNAEEEPQATSPRQKMSTFHKFKIIVNSATFEKVASTLQKFIKEVSTHSATFFFSSYVDSATFEKYRLDGKKKCKVE